MVTGIRATGRVIVTLDAVDMDQSHLRAQIERRTVNACVEQLATEMARRHYRNVKMQNVHVVKDKETGAPKSAKVIFTLTDPEKEEF